MLIGNTGNNRIQDKDIRITMNSQRHDDQAHGSHSAAIVDSSQCKGSDI